MSSHLGECLDEVLEVLSRRPSALITDVDGTLSSIVDDPTAASLQPGVLRALDSLSERLDRVVLLSGRSISQLRRMVDSRDLLLIGNHGLETSVDGTVIDHPAATAFVPHILEVEACLRAESLDSGVVLENKRVGLAIHYRRAATPAATRSRLLDLLASCPAVRGLRLTEGRMVLEVLPPIPMDKGASVRQIVMTSGASGAVYLGDDNTDLDAFRELSKIRGRGRCLTLSIAVRSDEAPPELIDTADWVLSGVDEVSTLLVMAAAVLEARV